MASIKQTDVKLLWGRAANRCAICRRELSHDSQVGTAAFPIGEQAHIVAEEPDGPRGQSPLTSEERNTYHNLLLLCPTHHTLVDKSPEEWPVEKLHIAKSKHELWVRDSLSQGDKSDSQTADEVALTNIIDSAVELCRLGTWRSWTAMAVCSSQIWNKDLPDSCIEFRTQVRATIWPSSRDELRRATITLSILLSEAAENFMRHAKFEGDNYVADKFYKKDFRHNPNYDADLEKFTIWENRCQDLLYHATGAANWFADVVRRDINPLFFVKSRFFVEGGSRDPESSVVEFLPALRDSLPESIKTLLEPEATSHGADSLGPLRNRADPTGSV